MSRLLRALCVLLPLVLAITGFSSRVLADWWLENLAVFVALLFFAFGRHHIALSNVSWALLFLFLCLHEYGAMYRYSNVPLGEAAKAWLHTDRNHYDRLIHFLYGLLLTWPVVEAFQSLSRLGRPMLYAIAVQFIMATSALYEIVEWLVASIVAPQLGAEFVGAQGDPWDSPEDMAAALVGSLLVILVLVARRSASSHPLQ